MTRKFLLALALLVSLTINAADKSTTMKPVIEHGEKLIEYLEDEKDMEVVHIEYDLIFKSSNTKTVKRNFSSGYTYYVMGFADYRVKDVDLELYRKNKQGDWDLVDSDKEDDSTPVVAYTVDDSGEYMIRLKAPAFEDDYTAAHYGLIIAHD